MNTIVHLWFDIMSEMIITAQDLNVMPLLKLLVVEFIGASFIKVRKSMCGLQNWMQLVRSHKRALMTTRKGKIWRRRTNSSREDPYESQETGAMAEVISNLEGWRERQDRISRESLDSRGKPVTSLLNSLLLGHYLLVTHLRLNFQVFFWKYMLIREAKKLYILYHF